MSHYMDIHLRPDPETTPHHLFNALYARLHRALVQLGSGDIGVSFPDYDERKPSLGTQLRLHGPGASLSALMATSWLGGLRDAVKVTEIERTPLTASHRRVIRVQAKDSSSRLRRLRQRAMRRLDLDEQAAAIRIPEITPRRLQLPFITLSSQSTGQSSFPLFIQLGALQAMPSPGAFNSYGLSQDATIPWF